MRKQVGRRALALALSLCLCLTLAPAVSAAQGANIVVLQLSNNQMAVDAQVVQVDDQSPLVAPLAEGGRTLVPVSRIVDAFGGSSTWDSKTNATTFTLDGKTVSHTIGSNTVQANGKTITMEVSSKAMYNRTYVPARYVLEGLGLWVGWDQTDQLVVVSREDLSEADLGSLSQSLRVSGRMGDLSAIGTRPCVPDLMAYFDLEERDYEIDRAEGLNAGDEAGNQVSAELKLVSGSDGQLLDGFLSVMEEFGFQLVQVAETEQDTARYGCYIQTFFFRYTGPGAEQVAALGEKSGEEYNFSVNYCNYYKSGGASKDKTVLSYSAADGLEVVATGVTDGEWSVEPYVTVTLPSRPTRTVVYEQDGKTTYVPNVMSYFGLDEDGYTRGETDGGYTLKTSLELVSGSDGQLLDEFIQIMQEQGFQLKHIATTEQDTARYGCYAQSLYFRYVGLDEDEITHLGQRDGKNYDMELSYSNYYAAAGASRDHTTLYISASEDLEPADTGAWDNRWNVTPEAASSGNGSGSSSSSGSGSWTPTTPVTTGGITCPICHGDGWRECGSCSGRGYFERRKCVPNYSGKTPKHYTVKEPCGACLGKGTKPCTACGGDGKIGV